jgi:hypothetical protein
MISCSQRSKPMAEVRKITATFTASGLGFKQRGPIGEAVASLPMRVTVNTREQKTLFELQGGRAFTSHTARPLSPMSSGTDTHKTQIRRRPASRLPLSSAAGPPARMPITRPRNEFQDKCLMRIKLDREGCPCLRG